MYPSSLGSPDSSVNLAYSPVQTFQPVANSPLIDNADVSVEPNYASEIFTRFRDRLGLFNNGSLVWNSLVEAFFRAFEYHDSTNFLFTDVLQKVMQDYQKNEMIILLTGFKEQTNALIFLELPNQNNYLAYINIGPSSLRASGVFFYQMETRMTSEILSQILSKREVDSSDALPFFEQNQGLITLLKLRPVYFFAYPKQTEEKEGLRELLLASFQAAWIFKSAFQDTNYSFDSDRVHAQIAPEAAKETKLLAWKFIHLSFSYFLDSPEWDNPAIDELVYFCFFSWTLYKIMQHIAIDRQSDLVEEIKQEAQKALERFTIPLAAYAERFDLTINTDFLLEFELGSFCLHSNEGVSLSIMVKGENHLEQYRLIKTFSESRGVIFKLIDFQDTFIGVVSNLKELRELLPNKLLYPVYPIAKLAELPHYAIQVEEPLPVKKKRKITRPNSSKRVFGVRLLYTGRYNSEQFYTASFKEFKYNIKVSLEGNPISIKSKEEEGESPYLDLDNTVRYLRNKCFFGFPLAKFYLREEYEPKWALPEWQDENPTFLALNGDYLAKVQLNDQREYEKTSIERIPKVGKTFFDWYTVGEKKTFLGNDIRVIVEAPVPVKTEVRSVSIFELNSNLPEVRLFEIRVDNGPPCSLFYPLNPRMLCYLSLTTRLVDIPQTYLSLANRPVAIPHMDLECVIRYIRNLLLLDVPTHFLFFRHEYHQYAENLDWQNDNPIWLELIAERRFLVNNGQRVMAIIEKNSEGWNEIVGRKKIDLGNDIQEIIQLKVAACTPSLFPEIHDVHVFNYKDTYYVQVLDKKNVISTARISTRDGGKRVVIHLMKDQESVFDLKSTIRFYRNLMRFSIPRADLYLEAETDTPNDSAWLKVIKKPRMKGYRSFLLTKPDPSGFIYQVLVGKLVGDKYEFFETKKVDKIFTVLGPWQG